MTYHEIGQAAEQHLPGVSEYAVHETNDKYENSLWQKESVAKDRGLDELSIIYIPVLKIIM
jgi:hypothetical protein